jgi:hypothetical protein
MTFAARRAGTSKAKYLTSSLSWRFVSLLFLISRRGTRTAYFSIAVLDKLHENISEPLRTSTGTSVSTAPSEPLVVAPWLGGSCSVCEMFLSRSITDSMTARLRSMILSKNGGDQRHGTEADCGANRRSRKPLHGADD